MKQQSVFIRVALAVLVLGSLTCPAMAQLPQDQVPFTATLTGPLNIPAIMIPLDPPILVSGHAATGEVAGVGKFNYIDAVTVHVGVDGKPLSMNNGVAALTAENGDAIFLAFSGPVRLTADPNVFAPDTTFTVTGGRGRFSGAKGSGSMKMVFDHNPGKDVGTWTIAGTISRPK